ncbi:MAG: anthranilate synthase component I family protein [Bacteroidetes bacterium]|nr:anthranilate synthase component I family protein [Bacteroidota bacterium]
MMRISKTYTIADTDDFRKKLSAYAGQFNCFAFLDSCKNVVYGPVSFDYALAAGAHQQLVTNAGDAFEQLRLFRETFKDYCFGFLGYDLKQETEQLSSKNFDGIGWPDMLFFVPEIYVTVKENTCSIFLLEEQTNSFDEIFRQINAATYQFVPSALTPLQPRIPAERYLQKVKDIIHHITEGDIYELNFCQEFYTNGTLDASAVFDKLCTLSAVPFAVLFKWQHRYLISASPERFLKKSGNKIISQPIKGTHKRGQNAVEDEQFKKDLYHSIKDRAENVMIVDLVRNDLTKHAITGSIQVEELFGIYSFPQVHQMVSTISAQISEAVKVIDVIKDAFPMGSMTGAPKVMAMQLIEQYEVTKRGLFSGAFGYFTPDNDFDFNVVIRSIQYNAENQYLSIQTGGAIVYDSVPEQELAECYLKLKALRTVLYGDETQ